MKLQLNADLKETNALLTRLCDTLDVALFHLTGYRSDSLVLKTRSTPIQESDIPEGEEVSYIDQEADELRRILSRAFPDIPIQEEEEEEEQNG